MGKRKEANIREKSLGDIFITEIVENAGVARASFYRNYRSKEDVLITLIRDVLDSFREESTWEQGNFYCYENILLSFQYFQKYKEYVLNLYRSGFASVLLEELNQFHESVVGSMPMTSVKKYELYMYIGALFNTALVWLSEGEKNRPEEIAAFFQRVMSSPPDSAPAALPE